MLSGSDGEFFSTVANELKSLAKLALQEYKPLANAVIRGTIDNEHDIDLMLDYMVSFCYDDKMLELFKAVLRSLVYKYPRLVSDHMYAYYEMFEPGKIGLEEDCDDT